MSAALKRTRTEESNPPTKKAKLEPPDFQGATKQAIDAFECAVCHELTIFVCRGHSLCPSCYGDLKKTASAHPVLRGELGALTKSYAIATALEALKKPCQDMLLQRMEERIRNTIQEKLPGLTLSGLATLANVVDKEVDCAWFARQIGLLRENKLLLDDDDAARIMEVILLKGSPCLQQFWVGPTIKRLVANHIVGPKNVLEVMTAVTKLDFSGIKCLQKCLSEGFMSPDIFNTIVAVCVERMERREKTDDVHNVAERLIDSLRDPSSAEELCSGKVATIQPRVLDSFRNAFHRLATGSTLAMRMLKSRHIRSLFARRRGDLDTVALALQRGCEPIAFITNLKRGLDSRLHRISTLKDAVDPPFGQSCLLYFQEALKEFEQYHLKDGTYMIIARSIAVRRPHDAPGFAFDSSVVLRMTSALQKCAEDQVRALLETTRSVHKLLSSLLPTEEWTKLDELHKRIEKVCAAELFQSVDIDSP